MRKFLMCCICCISVMFSSCVWAQSQDYYLENLNTTDTYVRSSVPNESFGNEPNLITGGWGDMYITMVKFNIGNLPIISQGDKVSLWFYNKSPGGSAQPTAVNIGLSANNFSDYSTWNNAGLSWYTSTIRQVNVNPYGYWTEFEITDYVNYWRAGLPNFGILLVPINTWNYFNFFQSSSFSTPWGQKPLLRITKASQTRFMTFPLRCSAPLVNGVCNEINYISQGAYTPQSMTSVLDHNMTALYQRDGNITSFTGEQFSATASYPSSTQVPPCYPKVGSAVWGGILSSVYIGTIGSGSTNCTTNQAINYDGHPGHDHKARYGTDVYTAAKGKVVNSSNGSCIPKGISAGCVAWGALGIDHENGYITQYLHLSNILVSPGQTIEQGQKIGLSGDIGVSGSPHLHFEVLKLRSGYANDYQPGSYATVDPYGFNYASGVPDVLGNTNGVQSVCLWISGCTNP